MVSKGTVFKVGDYDFTKYSSVVFFTEPCAVASISTLLSNLSLHISTSLIPFVLIGVIHLKIPQALPNNISATSPGNTPWTRLSKRHEQS